MKAGSGQREESVCFLLSPNTYTSFSPENEAQRAKWAECVAGGNRKGEILSGDRDRKRWALGEWEGIKKGLGDTGCITPSLPVPGNIPPNPEVGGGGSSGGILEKALLSFSLCALQLCSHQKMSVPSSIVGCLTAFTSIVSHMQ